MAKAKKVNYEELKKIWYKKLEKSGFEDIEQEDGNLKQWALKFSSIYRTDAEGWKAKVAYYQMAHNFLEEYKFDSNIEKVIWDYHSNGISTRDISALLKKARVKSVAISKSHVSKVINKLKIKMYEMYVQSKEEYHDGY